MNGTLTAPHGGLAMSGPLGRTPSSCSSQIRFANWFLATPSLRGQAALGLCRSGSRRCRARSRSEITTTGWRAGGIDLAREGRREALRRSRCRCGDDATDVVARRVGHVHAVDDGAAGRWRATRGSSRSVFVRGRPRIRLVYPGRECGKTPSSGSEPCNRLPAAPSSATAHGCGEPHGLPASFCLAPSRCFRAAVAWAAGQAVFAA